MVIPLLCTIILSLRLKQSSYFSICNEFKHIRERSLREPENSEELMDMLSFVEHARTLGMINLNDRIKVGYIILILKCQYFNKLNAGNV